MHAKRVSDTNGCAFACLFLLVQTASSSRTCGQKLCRHSLLKETLHGCSLFVRVLLCPKERAGNDAGAASLCRSLVAAHAHAVALFFVVASLHCVRSLGGVLGWLMTKAATLQPGNSFENPTKKDKRKNKKEQENKKARTCAVSGELAAVFM